VIIARKEHILHKAKENPSYLSSKL